MKTLLTLTFLLVALPAFAATQIGYVAAPTGVAMIKQQSFVESNALRPIVTQSTNTTTVPVQEQAKK